VQEIVVFDADWQAGLKLDHLGGLGPEKLPICWAELKDKME
jgi:hypothetical protein